MNVNKEEKALTEQFREFLQNGEKSPATVEKYLRDGRRFLAFLEDRPLSKGETVAYKRRLSESYAPASVCSMLVSLNCLLRFMGREDCCVRLPRVQKQLFCSGERELTKGDYRALLRAAGESRIAYVLRTICETGIRISELRYVTAEAVATGKAVVNCKNKTRVIFLPEALRKALRGYLKRQGIRTGAVFVTGHGKPLNRSNVWREMKALCRRAGVKREKVFPHNLRHLFARTFYAVCRDIVRLADLLGHSSINTTRIYTVEDGNQHRAHLELACRRLRS